MPSDSTINKFLMKAKEASKMATYPRQKLGSCLVYGNKVIALGYNTNKTSPFQYKYNRYRNFADFQAKGNGMVHAEGTALLKTRYLDINWKFATIYIYRELKDGTRSLSKPCNGCAISLAERGIGTVIFSTPKGYEEWRLKNGYYEFYKEGELE